MADRVLITGINGFAGQYVEAELGAAGYEVFGLTDSDLGRSEFLVADLRDAAAVKNAVRFIRPNHVIHLAAVSFVAHESVGEIYETNVVGSRNLLSALSELTAPPTSVILTSSANIYGNSTNSLLTEDAPFNPQNDYAISKVAMEFVARQFGDQLKIDIVRPFNYTGRGQAEFFLVPKIVGHFRRREPFIELGNVNVARDFSDVRFVAGVLRRLIQSDRPIPSVYNISSGQAVSLARILELCRELTGHHMDVKVSRALMRRNEVTSLAGDPSRLRATIGEMPAPDLKETLRWMLTD